MEAENIKHTQELSEFTLEALDRLYLAEQTISQIGKELQEVVPEVCSAMYSIEPNSENIAAYPLREALGALARATAQIEIFINRKKK